MVGRNTTDPFYAWCPELNRIVTVKEVWEFSFGERDKRINKKLTLLCPVKGCGAKLTVTGFYPVIMHRLHFRKYPREKHVHPKKEKKAKVLGNLNESIE